MFIPMESTNMTGNAMSADGNRGIAISSGIVIIAILVLTVLRLTHDQGKFKKIEESDKPQISELCLSRQTIPAGDTLVLANKSPDPLCQDRCRVT